MNHNAHVKERIIWLRTYRIDRTNDLISHLINRPSDNCKLIRVLENK